MNTSPAIYLDNNATTAMDPAVIDAMVEVMRIGPINPSSPHHFGRTARQHVERAIDRIGQVIHCRLDAPGGSRLIITSGGTEANNLAITGCADRGPILVSGVEHASVLAMVDELDDPSRPVIHWEVDGDGRVRLDQLDAVLAGDDPPTMVIAMSANNETGVLQPIGSIARRCHRHGAHFHVDATQSVGKSEDSASDPLGLNLDGELSTGLGSLECSGIRSLAFAAHKFHGPAGVGGLWIDAGVKVRPMMRGGEQQLDSRPGTESVALIVAMATALERSVAAAPASVPRMRRLRDDLEGRLVHDAAPVVVHGRSAPRLPNTTCVAFPGVDRQSLLMALDMIGVACSSTSACSSGSSPPSHVLAAMGIDDRLRQSTIRLAVSRFSTESEIDQAADAICRCVKRLRG